MIICKTRSDLTRKRTEVDYQQKVGFVPTMGNLHAGHLSLVNQALDENDVVVVSIFVNPLQFAPNEDFDNYPRTLEEDLQKLKLLERSYSDKQIIVFAPSSTEDVFEQDYKTKIIVEDLNKISEGQDRPEHFDGVSTVVFRLFQLVKPHNAYFGRKDYQQQLLIKKMVRDLMLPVSIHALPTVREESGLALSSRNQYLTPEQKEEALQLHQALSHIQLMIKNQFKSFQKILPAQIKEECGILLKQNLSFTYLEVRDCHHFETINENTLSMVILGAYRMDDVKILDNCEIHLGGIHGA